MVSPSVATSLQVLPRKVLHVMNSAAGGAALSTLGLISALRDRGVESCIACHVAGSAGERQMLVEATSGNTLFLPLYWWNRKIRAKTWKRPLLEMLQIWRTGASMLSTKAVAEFAKVQHVDLIHSNTITTLEGGYAARRLNVPHVWHIRELVGPGKPYTFSLAGIPLGRFLTRYSDRLIANSEITAQQVSTLVPANCLTVVSNGIDLSRFRSLPKRPAAGKLVCAMVGNVTSHWKKHALFISAAAKVDRELSIEWRIYGADPSANGTLHGDEYTDGLHRQIAAANLTDRFRFMGHVADPAAIMAEIDVLVHPADHESFGRVIVEAMAAEKPVVGVRGGGVAEIVVPEETGLLAEPDDADQLARLIERLCSDDDLRKRMGAAGRSRAESHYSIEACVDGVLQVYSEVLAKNGRATGSLS